MEMTTKAQAVLLSMVLAIACGDAGVGGAAAYKTTFTQVGACGRSDRRRYPTVTAQTGVGMGAGADATGRRV
jgi:hypothetical protein